METLIFFVVWFGTSYAASVFAERKGRGPGRWLLFALFLSPLLAFLVIHLLPIKIGKGSGFKRCSHCGNAVKSIARKCQYCYSDIA